MDRKIKVIGDKILSASDLQTMNIKEVCRRIIALSKEKDVEMKTPICYFKEFAELEQLLNQS